MFECLMRKKEDNEFIILLENYIRKLKKKNLTKAEKIHLLVFYLQSINPNPPEPTEKEMTEHMMLGWYMSSLLDD